MGAPSYLKVCLMSMICSVAVLAATNSEPYVAVSTVACFLEYQSTGVLLTKWRHPVKDLPVAKQWFMTEFRQPLQVQSHLEMPRILVQLGHIQRT